MKCGTATKLPATDPTLPIRRRRPPREVASVSDAWGPHSLRHAAGPGLANLPPAHHRVAAGAGIAGIPGALFAVPLVAVVNVMVKYIVSGEWRKPGRPELKDAVSPA